MDPGRPVNKRAALDDSAMGNGVSSKMSKPDHATTNTNDKDNPPADDGAPYAGVLSPAGVATRPIPRVHTSTIANLASIDSANQAVTPVPFVLPPKKDCHSNDTPMALAPATGKGLMALALATGKDEDEDSRCHEANTSEDEWENGSEFDSDDELECDDEKVVDLWNEKIEEEYMTADAIVQQHALTPEALDGIMERIPKFVPNWGVSEILGNETIMQLLRSLNLLSQSSPEPRTSKSPKDSADALLALLLYRLENSVRECCVNTNHWCILLARVLMPRLP